MKTIKNISLFFLMFYFCGYTEGSFRNSPSAVQYIPKEMKTGEDITYLVSYSFLKLGEVRLQVLDKKEKDGKTLYRTKAYIDSYKGIPFVNLHQVYESYVGEDYFSNYFRATEKENDYIKFTEYFFDYKKNNVHVKKGKYNPYEIWADSTTKISTPYQDGLSIFYYARMNTGRKLNVNVPCFVTEEFVFTRINFYDKIEKLKIDPINYDIACVKLDGHTDFVSVFGLTGNFEGWFTNDADAVPILAKMKVIIGNVSLTLKNWRKQGWNPPKYK